MRSPNESTVIAVWLRLIFVKAVAVNCQIS